MATTTKTLTPTNQTITLPDMTERPDASVLVDGIGKDADAINALSDQIATYRTWTRLMNNVAFTSTGYYGSFDLTPYKEMCIVLDTRKASDNQPFQYKNAVTVPTDMISANGFIFAVPLVVGEFVKFAMFSNQVSISELGTLPASANAFLISVYAR